MKKIVLSVIALALGMVLVLSVVVPLLRHTRESGERAYQQGQAIGPAVEQILK